MGNLKDFFKKLFGTKSTDTVITWEPETEVVTTKVDPVKSENVKVDSVKVQPTKAAEVKTVQKNVEKKPQPKVHSNGNQQTKGSNTQQTQKPKNNNYKKSEPNR
jgi:hypothetical protein